MSSMSWFINYLYCWIVSSCILHKKLNKILQEPDWPFVSFWSLKSLYFISSHSLSFVLPLPVIGCHSLSLVITRCHSLSLVVIRCHSIYHSFVVTCCHALSLVVPLVVIYCTTRCYSLSFNLPLIAIRYHSLSLVVTRYTGCLSFYKQSL